ncbi:hypothetical protein ON010_g14604 [Phytophthora cinnamomi]|nr:hypothetical protein ON010_g14604 [Phytophthora cinnamomi]
MLEAVRYAAAPAASMREAQVLVLRQFAATGDLAATTAAVGDTESLALDQLRTLRDATVDSTAVRLAQSASL